MQPARMLPFVLAIAAAVFSPGALHASDKDPVPPNLSKEQRERLQRFLQQHERPDRYIPRDAKLVDFQPPEGETKIESTAAKPIKQYTAQIISHRPVPGQEQVKQVDVYYYRPNPEKGKPGITVKHTVDLSSGKQVGQTEVLTKHHTPMSHEELDEAVELAKEKSEAVKALYKDREKKAVRWEYLQLMIRGKHETSEPGDRVVRLVFTASAGKDQAETDPVRVIVNLTKDVVIPDAR